MVKKIFLSLILAMSCTTVFAYGTYMGLGIGANNTSYRLKDSAGADFQFNARYPTVGVFVGDGAAFKNNFYLGAELFLSGGTGNTTFRNINNNMDAAKVSSTYVYGFDVMPGYILGNQKNTLLYGKLGLALARVELRGYITQNAINAGITDQGTTPRTFAGARVGLGLQQSLSKFIKVRGEYVYTGYRTLSVMDNSGNRDRLQPTTNQVTVALVYEFA